MPALLSKFLRVFFWCWLPVYALIILIMLALAIRGEMVDFTSLNTWAAFGMAAVFASLWALLPAFFFAALFSAVIFWRTSAASRLTGRPH
jgi:hypothetical protein